MSLEGHIPFLARLNNVQASDSFGSGHRVLSTNVSFMLKFLGPHYFQTLWCVWFMFGIVIDPKLYTVPSSPLYMTLRSRSQIYDFYVKLYVKVFRTSLFPNPVIDWLIVVLRRISTKKAIFTCNLRRKDGLMENEIPNPMMHLVHVWYDGILVQSFTQYHHQPPTWP